MMTLSNFVDDDGMSHVHVHLSATGHNVVREQTAEARAGR